MQPIRPLDHSRSQDYLVFELLNISQELINLPCFDLLRFTSVHVDPQTTQGLLIVITCENLLDFNEGHFSLVPLPSDAACNSDSLVGEGVFELVLGHLGYGHVATVWQLRDVHFFVLFLL